MSSDAARALEPVLAATSFSSAFTLMPLALSLAAMRRWRWPSAKPLASMVPPQRLPLQPAERSMPLSRLASMRASATRYWRNAKRPSASAELAVDGAAAARVDRRVRAARRRRRRAAARLGRCEQLVEVEAVEAGLHLHVAARRRRSGRCRRSRSCSSLSCPYTFHAAPWRRRRRVAAQGERNGCRFGSSIRALQLEWLECEARLRHAQRHCALQRAVDLARPLSLSASSEVGQAHARSFRWVARLETSVERCLAGQRGAARSARCPSAFRPRLRAMAMRAPE